MRKLICTLCIITAVLALSACSSKKGAGDYYDDGIEALENGRYEDACKNFSQAISLRNDKAIYYIEYGQALTKVGKYQEAIKQYQKAVVKVDSSITNPNKKMALRGQGVANFYLAKYDIAVQCFKDALDLDCKNDLNTDISSYLAQCYVKQEQYKEALGVYNSLIEEKETASLYAQRGQVNALMENLEQAKKDYTKAISMDEKNYSLYLSNYKMLIKAGDEEAADAVLTKAAEIKPESKEDNYQLAEVKFYLKDYDGALSILQGLTSDIANANQLIGDVYYATKDYDNAIKNYLAYLESGAQGISSTSYYNLSTCYIAKKNYDEALKYVEKGLKAGDKTSLQELQYNEILIYEQYGDFNTAYKKAKEYVKAYPNDKKMKREYVFLATRYKK